MAFPTELRERRNAVVMIVLSCLMIAGGVTTCVLTSQVAVAAVEYMREDHQDFSYSYKGNFWWQGGGFIVAGIIGVTAGATCARAAHITNIITTVIALIVYGIWSLALLLTSSIIDESVVDGYSCEYSSACQRMTSYFKGVTAVVVISWVLTLCVHVISCTKACCTASQPGAVILHQGPTTTVVTSQSTSQPYIAGYAPQAGGYAPQAGYAPQGGYAPQAGYVPQAGGYAPQAAGQGPAPPAYTTNDTAVLVKAQY